MVIDIHRIEVVVPLLAVLIVSFAIPTTEALAAGSSTNPVITSDHCAVTIEFDTAALVPYRVVILDDNVVVFDETVQSAVVGETLTFVYTTAVVGDAAPGVGIYIYEGGAPVFDLDPYTGVNDCQPGCEASLPAGSVVGSLLIPTITYWAPQLDAATDVKLGVTPSSKSYWVLGQDASRAFYKIALACNYLWVPVETMGPNYDAVWNGTPLPDRVVK